MNLDQVFGKMGNSLTSINNSQYINIPIPRNLPTTSLQPQSFFSPGSSSNQPSLHCKHVQKYLDIDGWCKKCTMKSVNTGHQGLDKLIRHTQSKSSSWTDAFLEWIPFESFRDIQKIGDGGFGVVYRATWIQGRRKDRLKGKKGRNNKMQDMRTSPINVTLKCIKNSQEMSDEYLKKLKSYYKSSLIQSRKRMQQLLKFYGISQDPSTGEYILVTQYAIHGSLRLLLHRHFSSFRWTEKIWWLCDIISNLLTLHKAGIVHGNIHSGNVLQIGDLARETTSALSDTGLNYPASPSFYGTETFTTNVYGVLPYLAPEVILGKGVSKRSDIYSIGILMIEILTGIPPFSHRPHDDKLALEICQGLRPELAEGTPKVYGELAKHCCCTDPSMRPTAKQLLYIFNHWWSLMNTDESEIYQIKNSFLSADKLIPDIIEEKRIMAIKSDEAIYTSRLLQFQNVLDRRNISNYSTSGSTTNYEGIITNNESISSSQFLLLDLNLPDITIDL